MDYPKRLEIEARASIETDPIGKDAYRAELARSYAMDDYRTAHIVAWQAFEDAHFTKWGEFVEAHEAAARAYDAAAKRAHDADAAWGAPKNAT